MNTRQVAEKFRVSPATVQRWVKDGALQPIQEPNPYLRRARALTFRRSVVEQFSPPPRKPRKPRP